MRGVRLLAEMFGISHHDLMFSQDAQPTGEVEDPGFIQTKVSRPPGSNHVIPGAGFMNRRRLCQLTAAILTSDLTKHRWVL